MTVPDITPGRSAALCLVAAVLGAGIGLAVAQRIRRRDALEAELWRR